MKLPEGAFIVLEGLDGAGTTTQARMLHSHLQKIKIKSSLTYEPTDGPAGKLIRDALSGRIYSPGSNQKVNLSEKALCLLFAADRLEHSKQIEQSRHKGVHTICDRYILSSLAYQSLECGIDARWVIEVNRGCSKPDLTILLKVPVEECARRLRSRKDMPTIYEKRETLRAIDKNYEKMLAAYRRHFGPVVKLNGTGTLENIQARIQEIIHSRLKIG